ncbi:MAG: hypothetical protein IT210_06755 [Armatimonadetes bacterium]|nr:hypothetical protein [Armatimonadota bacterium]
MKDHLLSLSDDDLAGILEMRVEAFREMPEERQGEAVRVARGLIGKGLPLPVVWAGVEAAARLLPDTPPPAHDAMSAPRVREFMQSQPKARRSRARRRSPPNEVRRAGREHLHRATQSLLEEARRARSRHEIRKMRQALLKIDQSHLRRSLGKSAEELCFEINNLLRRWASLF